MRARTSLSFSLAVAVAAVVGCGGSVSSNAPSGDASTTDTGASDAGQGGQPDSDAGDCTGPFGCTNDITLTVLQSATPQNMPLAGAFVRASTSATQFVDTKTDAMGVAHLRVDPAKGPYDVTVALAGFMAVSILGVTDSIPGNIVLSPTTPGPPTPRFTATGTITGVSPANRLQIDAFDWDTVVTKAGDTQYSTHYLAAGNTVALRPVAIEIDNSLPFGLAVNGYSLPVVTGAPGPLTIPITMPTPAVPATQSSITIHWPSGGVLTAGSILDVLQWGGRPFGFVQQWQSNDFTTTAVGLANLDAPSNGSSVLRLQTFGGNMRPDVAGAIVGPQPQSNGGYVTIVYAHTLAPGATVDVNQVDGITLRGTNLGDLTFAVASTGYDAVKLFVASSQGTTETTIWVIYAPGGKVASRSLPYLPSGVALDDLAGPVSTASVAAEVEQYVRPRNPWEAVPPDMAVVMGNAKGATLDPAGR